MEEYKEIEKYIIEYFDLSGGFPNIILNNKNITNFIMKQIILNDSKSICMVSESKSASSEILEFLLDKLDLVEYGKRKEVLCNIIRHPNFNKEVMYKIFEKKLNEKYCIYYNLLNSPKIDEYALNLMIEDLEKKVKIHGINSYGGSEIIYLFERIAKSSAATSSILKKVIELSPRKACYFFLVLEAVSHNKGLTSEVVEMIVLKAGYTTYKNIIADIKYHINRARYILEIGKNESVKLEDLLLSYHNLYNREVIYNDEKYFCSLLIMEAIIIIKKISLWEPNSDIPKPDFYEEFCKVLEKYLESENEAFRNFISEAINDSIENYDFYCWGINKHFLNKEEKNGLVLY